MDTEQVIELSIEVPVPVADAWKAVATGPGIGSWFVPCELEEHQGGSMRLDFAGSGTQRGRVVEWDPPTRFAYVDLAEDGSEGLTYEWHLAENEAEGSTVHLRNSGFGHGADAEAHLRGLSLGWPIFLHNLRLHLTHFPGLHARAITPAVGLPGDNERAWGELCDALEVQRDLGEGAHFTTSGEGVPMLVGTIETNFAVPGELSAYLVLIEAPSAGTAFLAAEGSGPEVACSVWLYLYDEDRDQVEDRWTPFLEHRWGGDAGQPAQ